MTVTQILTKLGYKEAEVEYDNEILQDITEYLTSKEILVSELTHRDKGYKMVGSLYKYFYLEKFADRSLALAKVPDVNDGEYYANHFWKRYGDVISSEKYTI